MDAVRARAAAAASPPLLESRLRRCSARSSRASRACRTSITSTPGSSSRSGSAGRPGGAGAAGAGLPRRRVRGHGRKEPDTDMAGVAAVGQLWSTVGGPVPLGGLPGRGRRRRARRGDRRGDVGAAGRCTTPTSGCSAGGSASSSSRATARSSAATAARWPDSSPASTSTAKTASARPVLTNSGTRGNTDFAIELAQAAIELWPPEIEPWRPEPAPPAEIAAPRPMVVGGLRVRLLVGGRQADARTPRAPRGKAEPCSSRHGRVPSRRRA